MKSCHPPVLAKQLKKLFLLGIFLHCASLSDVFAQASLSTKAVILADTSYLGDTATLTATIQNVGNQSYTGPISIHYLTMKDSIPLLLCTPVSVTLGISDSIQMNCILTFDTTHFDTGSNIIVVWSSGAALATPADSLLSGVYLKTQANGVPEENFNSSIAVYPTLARDYIIIELKADAPDKTLFPEAIKVRDVFGRIINGMEITPSGKNKIQVNTSTLSNGVYLLEIYFSSNRRMTSKFIRQ